MQHVDMRPPVVRLFLLSRLFEEGGEGDGEGMWTGLQHGPPISVVSQELWELWTTQERLTKGQLSEGNGSSNA